MIRIAPEGWPFVLPGAGLTGILGLVAWLLTPDGTLWSHGFLGAACAMGVLTAFVVYFFRDPVRRRRTDENAVFSPADGRVVLIEDVEEPAFMGGFCTRISIFLSIFDVHVQRAPITSRVGFKEFKAGEFAAAWNASASDRNEQASLGLVADEHRVMVRQIAGLVARRIVTDPKEGDFVPQGSRIGLIRFGSRVDLFFPPHWDVTCKKGDRVKGGQTVMARIPRGGEGGT